MQLIKKIIKVLFYKLKNINKKVYIGRGCFIGGFNTFFEGANRLGENTSFYGRIGFASYIGSNCSIEGTVGRFCSISNNVHTVIGTHPTTTFVSTHPAFFSTRKQAGFTFVNQQLFLESVYADDEKHQVVIGNDVWVGFGAIILSGVKIGNGAIIGAGAIVTKDVDPYAIVGGIPAKVISYRFNEEEINFLEKSKWWDRDLQWLKENAEKFTDIKLYKKFIEEGDMTC